MIDPVEMTTLDYIYKSFALWFIAGGAFGFIGLALHYVQDIFKYFALK